LGIAERKRCIQPAVSSSDSRDGVTGEADGGMAGGVAGGASKDSGCGSGDGGGVSAGIVGSDNPFLSEAGSTFWGATVEAMLGGGSAGDEGLAGIRRAWHLSQ
jgi:hypothetical protein